MKLRNGIFLVTGGAGFVGSHLSEFLISENANVVIVDDLSNGSLENLENIRNKVEFVEFDITSELDKLNKVLPKYSFNGIFHLACFPRSMSLDNPIRDIEVNTIGTMNILELARKNLSKVVFTSNSGIYGNPDYLPIDEKHPDNPSTPYDANKLVSEYYLKIYYRIYGLPIGICRLATVYGERQRTKEGWKPVIPEFVSKLMSDTSPIIYWDGNQTRDLIYVKDVVQGLVKAMLGQTKDEVFILGTAQETSINEIFDLVSAELGKNILPVREQMKPGDIERMRLSYDKAKNFIDFEPNYKLADGIKNYIKWYKEQ